MYKRQSARIRFERLVSQRRTAMEREKFVSYRDKIVEILLSCPEAKTEARYICASALNEIMIDSGVCCQIKLYRPVYYGDNDKT